jgi:hypothetical protein
MEFGWWSKDDEGRKYQICAELFGRDVLWRHQLARFQPWESHEPTDADWDRLIAEAGRRVPRRLLSPKQFDLIKSQRP